jgi:type IV pilus assembly protein PilX
VGQPSVRRTMRGVSMLFALMTLVALSLAAVALVRSVDTGALILGNMGFKDDTVMASDEAMRVAMGYLSKGQADGTLDKSVEGDGFYIDSLQLLDVAGTSMDANRTLIDWKLDGCKGAEPAAAAGKCVKPVATALSLPNGVTARYLVMKMCSADGATVDCLGPTSQKSEETSESGELNYKEPYYAKSSAKAVYYRIIVRTDGARDAVTYTEAIVHNYDGEEAPAAPTT